ncbi:hypothetical protein GCM10009801_62810 [Streptomyces albiaxialis]|uniref:Uncharacterized protein n=1 Tax=Streptomyces albiaxialis TaxID=329523 RepID=A0ABP5I7Q8_9ACTN
MRGHYRNGRYVRAHERRINDRAVVTAGGGSLPGLLRGFLILLWALTGGGASSSETPDKQPTKPAGSHSVPDGGAGR